MIGKRIVSVTRPHVSWPLTGILLLSLLLNNLGIWYGLPYPPPPTWHPGGDDASIWAFDNLGPTGPLAAAKDGFMWGRWSEREYTYPLAQYMLLSACYAPYVGYLFLSGGFESDPMPDYPYGLSDPTTALTVLTLITRLVVALMGTAIVLFTYLIANEFFNRTAALFSALTVALCNGLIFYAHNPTLDIPYLFWSMLALYGYALLAQWGHLGGYMLLGACSAIAVATKDQAYGLFLLLPLPILWSHYRHHGKGSPSAKDFFRLLLHKNLVLAVLSFLAAFVLANNLIFNLPRYALHVRALLERNVYDRYLDPSSITDHFRLFGLTMDFSRRAMGLPLFVVSVAGMAYCVFRFPRRAWLLLVPVISFYVAFIVMAAFYVHARHVLPLAIFSSIFGGKFIADLLANRWAPAWASYPLLILIFGYSLLYGLNADLTLIYDSRRIAGEWMNSNVPKGAYIEVYSKPIFLPWHLEGYQIHLAEFGKEYTAGLERRKPDYVLVTENLYRSNTDQVEAERFHLASQQDQNLRALLSGELGYQLQAMFKFKLHDWFFPDMVYGQNPRILVFERVSD